MVTCPSHIYTAGVFLNGAASFNSGAALALSRPNGTTDWYDPSDWSLVASHTPTAANFSHTIGIPAVDDDGIVYGWCELTTAFFQWELYRMDLATGATTLEWQLNGIGGGSYTSGIAWNPHDGHLYCLASPQPSSPGMFELWRFDRSNLAAGPTVLDAAVASASSDDVSDVPVFTADGGLWYTINPLFGDSYPVRYDLHTSTKSTPAVTGSSDAVPVPASDAQVWYPSAAGGVLLDAFSVEPGGCPLFDSGGTVIVSTGASGLVTFVYPSTGGIGTAVYQHQIGPPPMPPTGGWRVGRIGFPRQAT